jgi:hypothetical protein
MHIPCCCQQSQTKRLAFLAWSACAGWVCPQPGGWIRSSRNLWSFQCTPRRERTAGSLFPSVGARLRFRRRHASQRAEVLPEEHFGDPCLFSQEQGRYQLAAAGDKRPAAVSHVYSPPVTKIDVRTHRGCSGTDLQSWLYEARWPPPSQISLSSPFSVLLPGGAETWLQSDPSRPISRVRLGGGWCTIRRGRTGRRTKASSSRVQHISMKLRAARSSWT